MVYRSEILMSLIS